MDYTKLTLQQCFNFACQEFGLEEPHTIAIGKLVNLVNNGIVDEESATNMARFIYHDGYEVSLYYCDDEEDNLDEGFDPYMGCYTGDC